MMLLAVVCRGWSRLSPYGLRREGHETKPSSQPRSISADQRGSTAVEFAIVSPILILLLLGIVVYGGYFMLSHSLQEMADDAARASIAGLTDTERSSLAQSAVSNDIQTYSYFSPQLP
jgi:Flp pilus assembly protein TadG